MHVQQSYTYGSTVHLGLETHDGHVVTSPTS